MDLQSITPEAVYAQKQAITLESAGVLVLRKALDAQSSEALQLIQMMNQNTGVGTAVDAHA